MLTCLHFQQCAYSAMCLQLVELKNGEAYNGKMDSCDTWMNIHLKEVICTSKDGESFWRMKEVYIRGNTIKYIRVPDDTLGKAAEDKPRKTGVQSVLLNPTHGCTFALYLSANWGRVCY